MDTEKIIKRMKSLETSGDFAELAKKVGKGDKRRNKFRKMRKQMRLTVFADSEAVKLAQKLYTRYVSQTDTAGFLLFVYLLDQFMMKERKRVKNPVALENDDDPEEEGDDEESLQENFEKIRKGAGNDEESDEFPSQAALDEALSRVSVFLEESRSKKNVNSSKLPPPLKKFLGDIRATDKFTLLPDTMESSGVLTLTHSFPSIAHRQAYKGLAGMFARAFKSKVKINEDKKAKNTLLFNVGRNSFLVNGTKVGKNNVIRISLVKKK
jgi:hypothetical protein